MEIPENIPQRTFEERRLEKKKISTVQIGGLKRPGTLTLIPVEHVSEAFDTNSEGCDVTARIPMAVERAQAQKVDKASVSRSTQTEISPQFDMACWLAKTLLHMDLDIQTHPDARPRSVRRDHPGDFFYLFAQENWQETMAALWTIFTNSEYSKAELYDMVLGRGGDDGNVISVLYESPAVRDGRIVFPGFTAPELKLAHDKLIPRPSDLCPEEQVATTVRYEVVGGREYMAKMAPPITTEIQEKLHEAFAAIEIPKWKNLIEH